MHCSECKTVIDKAVMIMDTTGDWTERYEPKRYCKKCFKREFMNE